MPPYPEMEIGDIEVKESRSNTLSLLKQFYVGINCIIEFFMTPTSRTTSPAISGSSPAVGTNDPQAANLPPSAGQLQQGAEDTGFDISISEFTVLIYRYLIGLFDCSELFMADETRSKEMVQAHGSHEV